VAGKEPASKGEEPTTKYQFLLPYFVLGGMAGMRTCELVRSNPGEPDLNWEDILWAKNLILIRHEVAKQTRSRDQKRYVPLEPAAAEILRPLAAFVYRRNVVGYKDEHTLFWHERNVVGDVAP
jgi:hypothetical protein